MINYTIQNSIQNYILSIFRTNNPIIDAITTCIITGIFSFFLYYQSPIINYVKNKIQIKNISSVNIYKWHVDDDTLAFSNTDYDVFLYYINHYINNTMKYTNGNFDSCYISQDFTYFVPAKDCVLYFDYENEKIYYVFSIEKDKDGKIKNKKVTLYNYKNNIELLKLFINNIRNEYFEYKQQSQRRKKYQIIHTPSIGSNGIIWNSRRVVTRKTFDSIILDKNVKNDIYQDIVSFSRNEKWYAKNGQPYKRGYLLYGKPGTGKTSVILAISQMLNFDIYHLDLSRIKTKNDLDSAFATIPPEKCCIVFEDIDCMSNVVKERKYNDVAAETYKSNNKDEVDNKEYIISLNDILYYLDGITDNHNKIYIMTTNHPEVLDPAIIRPGRIDKKILLDFCSIEMIIELFGYFYNKDTNDEFIVNLNKDLQYQYKTNVLSPAFIVSIIQQYTDCPESAKKNIMKEIVNKKVYSTCNIEDIAMGGFIKDKTTFSFPERLHVVQLHFAEGKTTPLSI